MALKGPRSRGSLNFECGICQRKYRKKEHLQRHERTHTGIKPFSCQSCGRSFSRGDVLNRHARVHRGSVGPDLEQTESPLSENNLQHPVEHRPNDLDATPVFTSNAAQDSADLLGGLQSTDGNATLQPVLDRADVRGQEHAASSLLWPDSEDFFESIMSLDSMSWDQHLPLMPLAEGFSQYPPDVVQATQQISSGDDDTRVEHGRRAVQTLNGLISNTLFSVTAPTALSDLTPRFLDSSLHMFFTKFMPTFPIIHRPTFVFRDCSAPLLLNAIALGSLFLGSSDAIAKGEGLWRLAHIAIATSWPTMITQRGDHDSCSGIQLVLTALLSQIYAALSRDRTLRMTSQTFYGLNMYWARYCGMFELRKSKEVPSVHDTTEVKAQAWRSWVSRETQLRTLLGLYIIDGVVAQYSGNPSLSWPTSNPLPLPTDDEIFNADTSDSWIRKMGNRSREPSRFCDLYRSLFSSDGELDSLKPRLKLFDIKVILEMINSLATESSRIDPPPIAMPPQSEIFLSLGQIRDFVEFNESFSKLEKSIALLRWHAICLDLVGPTARGARRMCHQFGIKQHIFGGERREESDVNPYRWVQGEAGRKALLHASKIQEIATQMPMGLAHDAYVPGAVFAAATTYSSFALVGISKMNLPTSIDWKVVLHSGLELVPRKFTTSSNMKTRNTAMFITGHCEHFEKGCEIRNLSYDLSSIRILLRGLSLQWGVAQEMEEVVEAWMSRCP